MRRSLLDWYRQLPSGRQQKASSPSCAWSSSTGGQGRQLPLGVNFASLGQYDRPSTLQVGGGELPEDEAAFYHLAWLLRVEQDPEATQVFKHCVELDPATGARRRC